MSKPKSYSKRVVISGNIVEIYDYKNPIWKGLSSNPVGRNGTMDDEDKRILYLNGLEDYQIVKHMDDELMNLSLLPFTDEEEVARKSTKLVNTETGEFHDFESEFVENLYETIKGEMKEKNRAKVVNRARTKITRLVNANSDLQKFLTFTFKEQVTDVKTANKYFKQFIQRLKRYIDRTEIYYFDEKRKQRRLFHSSELKYVAVIEFTKQGRIHYHALFNFPFIQQDHLYALWQNRRITYPKKNRNGEYNCLTHIEVSKRLEKRRIGSKDKSEKYGLYLVEYKKPFSVKIACVGDEPSKSLGGFVYVNALEFKKNDNVGNYIVKYMNKDNMDKRLEGQKSYLTSTTLLKPLEIIGSMDLDEIKKKHNLNSQNHLKTKKFDIPETENEVTYSIYNLSPQFQKNKKNFELEVKKKKEF